MKRLLAVLAFVLVSGCASHGVQVDPARLSEFKEGVTTEQDVITALGQPTSVNTSAYGRMLIYAGATAQARPASFIPIVGAFAGGSDVQSSAVVFRFGSDGKLVAMNHSQSRTGSSTGFAANTPIQQVPDQPRKE